MIPVYRATLPPGAAGPVVLEGTLCRVGDLYRLTPAGGAAEVARTPAAWVRQGWRNTRRGALFALAWDLEQARDRCDRAARESPAP